MDMTRLRIAVVLLCAGLVLLALFSWMSRTVPEGSVDERGGVETMPSTVVEIEAATGSRFSGDVVRKFSKLLEYTHGGDYSLGGDKKCEKWAVLTTIFSVSKAIRNQIKLPDWCLVIVADRKTPQDFMQAIPEEKRKNVVYLTVEYQEGLANQFVRAIPWNNFGRKNIGYMYAIQHGATVLWDFDDDNILKHTDPSVSGVPHLDMEAQNGIGTDFVSIQTPDNGGYRTFNPYPTVHAPALPCWPRGLPLQDIKQEKSFKSPLREDKVVKQSIGVLQSLADIQPDVDAIYRFTMKIPFSFDSSVEVRPLLVPKRTLTPYNAQATLHFQKAFWALFLPVTVQGRVSDIWRSYIAQRLFWDCGLSLGFSSRPLVNQDRNYHDLIKDLSAEDDLYKKGEQLVDFLLSWRSTADSLKKRVLELYIAMYERAYLEEKDVLLVQLWLSNLSRSGYKFPKLLN